MDGILKFYNLPGKLLAELWYLWPKKGQIWASGRRREHGFVHFMYSSVFYAIAAFLVFGGSAEPRSGAADEVEAAAPNAEGADAAAQYNEPYAEPEAVEPALAKDVVEQAPDEPAPSDIVFESNPVVQDIPVASEGDAPLEAPDE